jgi:hypothetical protein
VNRPGGNAKLAAGLVGVMLAEFLPVGGAQAAPPNAIIARGVANQNPVPPPSNVSDYGLLNQAGSGQATMLSYINPSVNRKTPRYSLVAWPRTSLFAQIESDEINRSNAISGSTTLAISDVRLLADGITPHFSPLLEIQLGAYKLPLFLYVPNPQADQPSW